MKCSKCQTDNPETKKFCRKCGGKPLRPCPECGSESLPDDEFCGDCGHPLFLPTRTLPKELTFDEKIAKVQKYLPGGLSEKILSQRDRIEGKRKAVGYSPTLSWYYQLMAMIHLDLGGWESARRYAEDGLKEAQTRGEKLSEGWLRIHLGSALAKANPSQAARGEECILQGIKSANELGCRPASAEGYLRLGELYADTGQREKALRKARRMFNEMGINYWPAQVYVNYGELCKLEGNLAKAKESFRTVIDIFRECRADSRVARYEEELARLGS